MPERKVGVRFPIAIILSVTLLALACSGPADDSRGTESTPSAALQSSPSQIASPMPRTTSTPSPSDLTPKPAEVREALARVFDKALILDERRVPNYLIGDFNGDGSEDLAALGMASENSLPEINNELANWTLEDPQLVPIPGTKAAEQQSRPAPVRAAKGESLLAIIHGVATAGWRSREARQTYLLKAGDGSNLAVEPLAKLRMGAARSHLPPLRGDVISERLGVRSGFLFWNGARYAWFTQPK